MNDSGPRGPLVLYLCEERGIGEKKGGYGVKWRTDIERGHHLCLTDAIFLIMLISV